MSTRKKNAEPPRHNKPKQVESPPPPQPAIDVNALLMVGEERVHIVYEEDDNITFMAEVIDTL